MRVCEKDAKPWEFLRGYPEVAKVEANDENEESFIAVRLLRACLYSSFWAFECSMECFRIYKSLRSGREVNKQLRKQYICCVHNVHDAAGSYLLEEAKLLQVLRKIDFNRGVLQSSAFKICKLVDIAVGLFTRSTMLSTTKSPAAP